MYSSTHFVPSFTSLTLFWLIFFRPEQLSQLLCNKIVPQCNLHGTGTKWKNLTATLLSSESIMVFACVEDVQPLHRVWIPL